MGYGRICAGYFHHLKKNTLAVVAISLKDRLHDCRETQSGVSTPEFVPEVTSATPTSILTPATCAFCLGLTCALRAITATKMAVSIRLHQLDSFLNRSVLQCSARPRITPLARTILMKRTVVLLVLWRVSIFLLLSIFTPTSLSS